MHFLDIWEFAIQRNFVLAYQMIYSSIAITDPEKCSLGQVRTLTRGVGFTLLELLVVISIIAILSAILMPTIKMIRQSAMALKCSNNQKSIAVAIFSYSGDNDGIFPYAFDSRVSKFYEYYVSDYLPRPPGVGRTQISGRMYDCPVIPYDYASVYYNTKAPDYGPNSAIMPRYSPGISEGSVARISRSSEVVFLGDASPGMTMGLNLASYYISVTPAWINTRQRSPFSSFPSARHPRPNDLSDPLDGLSVGGQYFVGVMADLHAEKIAVTAPEFSSPSGRQTAFTQP